MKHLSYSSISTFAGCQRKWYLRYVAEAESSGYVSIALTLGGSFHKAVADYLVGKIQIGGLVMSFDNHFLAAESQMREDGLEFDAQPSAVEIVVAKVEDMLQMPEFVDYLEYIKPNVVAVEQRFEFNVEGVPIPVIGYIDAIILENDRIFAIDFKTAARKWAVSRAESDMQSTFYVLGLRALGYNVPLPAYFEFAVVTKTKIPKLQIVGVTRGRDDLIRAVNLIQDAYYGMSAEVKMAQAKDSWMCGNFCEFWNVCERGLIPAPEKGNEQS